MTLVHLPEPEAAEVVEEVDLSTLTLDELAKRATTSHGRVGQHLRQAVARGVEVGLALLAAKDRVEWGEWYSWLESNTPISIQMAGVYMRVAYYRDELPNDGVGLTFPEARRMLSHLPDMPMPARGRVHPRRGEAVEMVAEGASYELVASLLGVSQSTVFYWCNPEASKNRQRKASERLKRKRAERAALREKEKREERDRLAREKGGNLGKAYDAVRKLQPVIDAAIAEGLPVEARALLVRVEDEIFKALKR